MDKSIPKTEFKPLKKPFSFEQKAYIEYKKYLDEIYSKDWMNNYFKLANNEKK